MTPSIDRHPWGTTPDGQAAELYTLCNSNGMTVRIATYGGTVVSLSVPDREGHFASVVLGFETLAGYTDPAYIREAPCFGALIGRYANRIAKGRFSLDGVTVQLTVNNGPNHLHGGIRGLDKVIWTAVQISDPAAGLELSYSSPDGDEGYPGTLAVRVLYTLTEDNSLRVEYAASTDRDTVINLSNHSYFNLKGAGRGDILGHELQVAADRFTPVDATLIPTGDIVPVAGTPFDFTRPMAIGARIENRDGQLSFGRGYDHNFVLRSADEALKMAARLWEPTSGRTLEIWTTEPGLQLYSGNFLKGNAFRGGVALETQHFPDSPNQPGFPSTTLKPGETFQSETVWRFGVGKSLSHDIDEQSNNL